jgi:uncharacterized membrane-anchored protein YjiN (DUF445 family)
MIIPSMPPNKLTENRTGPLKRRTLHELKTLLDNLDGEEKVRDKSSSTISDLTNSETGEVIRKCFEELPHNFTFDMNKQSEKYLKGKIEGISNSSLKNLLNGKGSLNFKHFQILQKIFPELKDKILEKYKEKLEKKSQQSPE